MKYLVLLILVLSISFCFAQDKNCQLNGIPLYGKVKVVTEYADFKVKIVKDYPDYKIKVVTEYANNCGYWQFTNDYPDFTVQFVNDYPDFTIQYVTEYPSKYIK